MNTGVYFGTRLVTISRECPNIDGATENRPEAPRTRFIAQIVGVVPLPANIHCRWHSTPRFLNGARNRSAHRLMNALMLAIRLSSSEIWWNQSTNCNSGESSRGGRVAIDGH
jgi:hypothetical protein